MQSMPAPRKYPDELRERATRMTLEARQDPATRSGAFRRVGEQLGINPETLRNWVRQAEIDEGHRPGVTTSEAARMLQVHPNTLRYRIERAQGIIGLDLTRSEDRLHLSLQLAAHQAAGARRVTAG